VTSVTKVFKGTVIERRPEDETTVVIHADETVEADEMPWRPAAIEARVEHGPIGTRVGPHVVLTQKLRRGDTGWTMMKIELPASWRIARTRVATSGVVLTRKTREQYRVGPDNVGAINVAIFARLDDGTKRDARLARIWETHARVKPARAKAPRKKPTRRKPVRTKPARAKRTRAARR
jgi:hypothetical protein